MRRAHARVHLPAIVDEPDLRVDMTEALEERVLEVQLDGGGSQFVLRREMAVHRPHADARGVGKAAHRKRRHPISLRDLIRVLQQLFPGNNALSHKAPLAIEPSHLQTGWVSGTMVTRFRKTLRHRYPFHRGGRKSYFRVTFCIIGMASSQVMPLSMNMRTVVPHGATVNM